MLSFESDYIKGAHPQILSALYKLNEDPFAVYGEDKFSKTAKQKIAAACATDAKDIFFLVGGTQTNAVVIATMLKDYEGVIAAQTGHINVHEAGAIEHTGHKVLPLPARLGKINAQNLSAYLKTFYADENYPHMVFPGMVYISQPTEYGTLYSKAELNAIYAICKEYKIPLYIDGARLGYALASTENDVSLPELAQLCDAFYIGGTKVGALCGEALVFTKNNTPSHFITQVKQHGALLAKGSLIGIQFDTLFTDNLYFKISKNAIDTAHQLIEILEKKGFKFFLKSPTNQQFVIVNNDKLQKLREHVATGFWEKYDENSSVIRFATSWATTQDELIKLKEIL
ncbi:aminotransferase class I/II-fold pyridoxal phosphate-dependent enzyme [Succinatimonas hippei]|uniref:threonine aldolase family protein n=1 Tax=Succinatimonas hippei TaxID=626938 RepID=UPI002011A0B1|nr:aminotransferase class I/II-fold pyridoxal phosphate-dependent enzyme [Succinatimonas hippei]MCL1603299.1 aminotransferase class I/II-fold pyridoxal phosphate-dependent enzyme [Succinatimonas hippei]